MELAKDHVQWWASILVLFSYSKQKQVRRNKFSVSRTNIIKLRLNKNNMKNTINMSIPADSAVSSIIL